MRPSRRTSPRSISRATTLSYAAFAAPHRADRARPEGRVRRQQRRSRRDPQPEPAGLSGTALCLRAARRHAGAAELAACRRRTVVHPVRRRCQGAGARAGLCGDPAGARGRACPRRASSGSILRLRRGSAFDALLDAGARRRPQSAYRSLLPAADRLHVRHDRTAQGRGAAPGSAAVERRDEPAHARPHLGRSRADRAAVLPRRRPQHPDHAGAAARRDRDDPSALHAGRDARGDRARPSDPDRAGAGDHPGGDRSSRLGNAPTCPR